MKIIDCNSGVISSKMLLNLSVIPVIATVTPGDTIRYVTRKSIRPEEFQKTGESIREYFARNIYGRVKYIVTYERKEGTYKIPVLFQNQKAEDGFTMTNLVRVIEKCFREEDYENS